MGAVDVAGRRSRSLTTPRRQRHAVVVPATSTAAEMMWAIGKLHPATPPQTALPTAIPPASTTRYSPSPRARTHHGRADWVATLSVTVAVVHAPPARNGAGPATHADEIVPTSTRVPAIVSAEAVTLWSLV